MSWSGPGLGVRIIGEVTAEKVKILQEADWVLRDEMAKNGYERQMAQFFCVLPGVSTVGVMGDHRTYDHLLAIRAVTISGPPTGPASPTTSWPPSPTALPMR